MRSLAKLNVFSSLFDHRNSEFPFVKFLSGRTVSEKFWRNLLRYWHIRIALWMVWLGSMHIPSFPFGFSFTRMYESQSVSNDCDWFYDVLLERLSNSSFTLSNFTWACTGLELESSSMCMGVPEGFPHRGL